MKWLTWSKEISRVSLPAVGWLQLPPGALTCRVLSPELGYPKGLARTLSQLSSSWPTPFRALRRPNVTLARHRIGQPAHAIAGPAFPVPGGVACVTSLQETCLLPTVGDFPKEGQDARLAVIFNEAHCYRPV